MASDQLNGFSPEVRAWLMGLGPDPFAIYEDQNSQVIGNWLPPEDEDEIGTMDWQNARLTAQSKANNEYSDFATIAQLGGSTGGTPPEAFMPFATYEPVQAPGYMAMNYYMTSDDPIMSYVAKRLDQGKTALQIESEIRRLIADGSPEGQEMEAAMPVYADEMNPNTLLPDWKRLSGEISKLEKDVLTDPTFNYIGEESGGLPANVKYEDTEIAKWYKERNLPNPYETYSPDLLAGRDQLSREGMNRDKQSESDIEFDVAKRSLATARAKADPRNNSRQRGMTLDGQSSGRRGVNPAQHENPEYLARVARHQGALGRLDGPSSRSGESGLTGSVGRTDSLRNHVGATQAQAADAARRSYVNAILARKENDRRRKNSAQDQIAQIDRQRMMDMLTRQGRTPFNDVNRARQGNVYGF